MNHTLRLKHLGPITECTLSMKKFTVFTGPQSSGKSTIAKAVYYFRTVKQDILNIMMQGGPVSATGNKNAAWVYTLQQRMREKFLQIFGTSWVMPTDMEMEYIYKPNVSIKVYLTEDRDLIDRNFVSFEFSDKLKEYLDELDHHMYTEMTYGQRTHEERELEKLFDDLYETIFIPAGRNLITLLSTQLNYIFTSLEGSQLRNIDYVTKRYTELILKLKPIFSDGLEGVLSETKVKPKHAPAIRLLQDMAEQVLRGWYRYVEGEERLYLDSRKYIKINFASSGQQEIVWVFNLLFYYLLEDRKVFLILEEPESHLYPDAQQRISEALGLFLNEGNTELITTHSPYVLGTFNYMLLAEQAPREVKDNLKRKLRKRFWIDPTVAAAYYIRDGRLETAMDTTDDLTLIKNELIDGASERINEISNFIIDQMYDGGEG